MAYDQDLADRVRAVIPRGADVTERKMFGGLAFLLDGHMFAGIVGNELMVRLGYQAAQQALERDHVREMDFTGRPAKNMIFVEPAGLRGPALQSWVTAAADHVRSCPRNHPEHPRPRALADRRDPLRGCRVQGAWRLVRSDGWAGRVVQPGGAQFEVALFGQARGHLRRP